MVELVSLISDNFEEFTKGKSQQNKHIILDLIRSLAKDIMVALDIRNEGVLDVR